MSDMSLGIDGLEKSFFEETGDFLSDAGSKAFGWLTTTEAGAGVMKGAAAGTAAYLIQEDKQKHDERMADKKYKREVDLKLQYSSAPLIDTSQVGNGLLNAAAVMQGDNGIVRRKEGV